MRILAPVLVVLAIAETRATPFEPKFSDYSFPGSQYTVDAAANAFFTTNYGITISNAYLYVDSRDTFDGIGVSAGTVANLGQPNQTGRITFLDTTDFVSVDFWSIMPTVYSALDTSDNVIATFSVGNDQLGTHLFSSLTRIGAITWTSSGGFGQVTGLRYDYDGTTDGRNTDLDNGSRVPDSASTGLLLVCGVGFLAAVRRRLA